MKKILIVVAIFCINQKVAFSQIRIYTANEVKLNVLTTLLLYPEIHFERVRATENLGPVKSDSFGYGFSAGIKVPGFTIGSDPEYHYYPVIYLNTWHLSTYCRYYFNRKHQFNYHFDMRRPQMFFLEPAATIVGYEENTSLCLGLSLGLKITNIMNYTAEFHIGAGNNLNRHNADFYYRFGVNIGWRSVLKIK